jgi:hypothetical protein
MTEDLIYLKYKYLFIFTVLLLGFLLVSGCSGGGTEVGNPEFAASDTPPSISNLVYSCTSSTNVETGEEEIILTGSVDFAEDDGNISNLIIDIIDSDGFQIEFMTETIEGFYGQTSGTVEFAVNIDAEPGDYIFEIYIMDEANNESNVLTGEFSI